MQSAPKKAGSEEASEEPITKVKRKLRRMIHEDQPKVPAQPEVDTMEYRPSDRPLSAYGPPPL